jgi:hypothetical protein
LKITRRSVGSIVILGYLAQWPAAFAADTDESRPLISIAVKVWNSSWLSYLPGAYTAITPTGAPALADSIDLVEGDRKTTTFPQLAVRKGNYYISASYAQYATDFRTPYSAFIGPNGLNVATSRSDHFSRKESDLTAGYFIHPNIALTAGFKYATETRDITLGIAGVSAPSGENIAKALIFGALVNLPIEGNLRAYSQLGYGPARVSTAFSNNSISGFKSSGRYLISEIGLNYSLSITDVFIKGANAGLGYRSQTVKTHSKPPAFLSQRDLRDVKDGIVFTLTVAI